MSEASVAATASSPTTTATQPRLSGHWLVLARVAWLSVAVLGLTMLTLSLPFQFAQLEQACTDAACLGDEARLHPQDLRALAEWGLSPAFIATYGTVLIGVVALGWIAMGVLLFARQSAEPRALFFSFCLMVFGTQVINPRATLAVAHPIWWLPATALGFLQDTSFFLFCYLFPTGQFVPRWTRWVILTWIVVDVPYYFFPDSPLSKANWPDTILTPFILGLTGCVIPAQVYRYGWRSTPLERQQTKWVLLALGVSLLLTFAWVPLLTGEATRLVALVTFLPAFLLAVLLIPLSIAASILRYRLWEIDALINKALVYGLLTTLLAGVYVGLILGLQALVSTFTGQTGTPPLVIVLSTLAIAALVLPVRRRIQNVIDRRFYRKKYDAEQTLAAFSATLRQEVDLAQVEQQLLAVVQETMQPEHVSLWLRPPEQRTSARWQPRASGILAPAQTFQHADNEPDRRQQGPEGGQL